MPIKYLCNFTNWDNDELLLHSVRHVVKGENSFFVVGEVLPVFQQYSFDGKLLKEYILEDIPEVQRLMKDYKRKKQEPNSFDTLIQDVYYDNGKIYLLLSTKEDIYSCNKILVFDVTSKIKHIGTLKLAGKVFESFCVKDKQLIAFNTLKASVDIFALPDFK